MSSSFLNEIESVDVQFTLFIQGHLSHPLLDYFFVFITDLHKQGWFQVMVILPLVIFWIRRERKLGAFKLGGLIFSLACIDSLGGQWIKKWVARPRPFMIYSEIIQKSPASGFGFISNHAANMVGLATFMSYFYPRWKYFWWSLALLVAFSRVYNGVHFMSDIVAGGMVGWAMSRLTICGLKRFKGTVP